MKNPRKMKNNNKGFSLIELIVVIAIMVVLVAILGSTILGYLERSKYSNDIQALDSIKTALSMFVTDEEANASVAKDGTNLLSLMAKTNDPNEVISSTLAEVFTITKGAGGVTKAVFNNVSATFNGIEADDIQVTITNGAVSIYVPVTASQSGIYEPYKTGTAYESETSTIADPT